MPADWITHVPDLALAAALAWGAGLRLYLVTFLFGLAGYLGYWSLPDHLQVLSHPLVMGTAGFMAIVELFADKLPWLDTIWDMVHTFIRIPAGAALAAAVFGDDPSAVMVAAGLLGGTLTAATHFSKAGTRAAVNTVPEPFSNMALSFAEDAAVVGGTWLSMQQPILFICLVVVFVLVAGFALHWLGKGARRLWRRAVEPRPASG
jgi:hypothetical protein